MTEFFTIDIDLFDVGLAATCKGNEAVFDRFWGDTREDASKGVMVGNAVWQFQTKGSAEPIDSLEECPIGPVFVGIAPAHKGAKGDQENVGERMKFTAVDPRVGNRAKPLS